MTSPKPPARKDRWLLAIGYGVLAEVATVATIVIMVTLLRFAVSRAWPGVPADDRTVPGVVPLIGVWGGALYTLIFARRLMSRISSHFVAHGIVVALAATALAILGSIAGHKTVPSAYLAASVLKIIAGAAAGFFYQRYMVSNPAG